MKSEYEVNAEKVLEDMGVTFTATYLRHAQHFPGETQFRDVYCCVFRRGNTRLIVDFGQSIMDSTYGKNPPSAYDVLSCITKNDPGLFSDFCSEYGYDPENPKEYSATTYRAVKKEWKQVEKFFAPEEIEILQEIQ